MSARAEPTSGEQQHDEWELPHCSLKVGRVLGAGSFGKVMMGKVSRALLRHKGLPARYSEPDGDREGFNPLLAPVAIKMLKGRRGLFVWLVD